MRKLLVFLSLVALISANKYEYQYRKNGIPSSRVEISTGIVQVYSDIAVKKITERMMDDIHSANYSDMKFIDFKDKLRSRYPNFKYKTKLLFRWVEFNDFKKIEALNALKGTQ